MQEQSNTVFALMTTPLAAHNGIPPRQHVYGAVITFDRKGRVARATPIDFNGSNIECNSVALCEKAILFPVTDETARNLVHSMDWLRRRVRHEENPFRFRSKLADVLNAEEREERLERFAERMERHSAKKWDDRMETNCIDFTLNLLESNGIPIRDLGRDGLVMPQTARVSELRKLISDSATEPACHDCTGALYDLGNGRKAYYLNSRKDAFSIERALPVLNCRDEAGTEMSVGKMLTQHSKPFFDAALVRCQKTHPRVAHHEAAGRAL